MFNIAFFKNQTFLEWAKCMTRRYTILFILAWILLTDAVYYILGIVLSLDSERIQLLIASGISILIVISIFLLVLNDIRDSMMSPLTKLMNELKKTSNQNLTKKIHIKEIPCDDELHQIIDQLNHKSDHINTYIDHLKRTIWYIQHEFNTPLATLSLWLERLRKKYEDTKIDELTEETHRLSQMLNSLVLLSEIHNKNNYESIYTSFELFNVYDMIENITNDLQSSYEHCDISYLWSKDIHIYSHKSYTYIIVKNLIENAYKYWSDAKWPEISVKKVKKNVHLIIKDYGVWMSQEELEKSYLPFWQSDLSREEKSWQWLWLTLVQELTTILDIKIQVTSVVKEWTTFTLIFSWKKKKIHIN